MVATDLLIHRPVVGFSPHVEEEFPMTMQIGMVGTDGIVLASDTKWTDTQKVRHTFNSTKIKVNHERGIAVSYARNMETSRRVADRIISDLRSADWEHPIQPIEEIGAKVLATAGERKDAQCLILFAKPSPRLFLFQFGTLNGQPSSLCEEMSTTGIAGDNVNPAIFWSERYYQARPVHSLVPLAAQLIVAASKLNPGAIGGLEIVLCDASGFHRLSKDSIRELESKAEERDRNLGELLVSQTQQFTYTPNAVG